MKQEQDILLSDVIGKYTMRPVDLVIGVRRRVIRALLEAGSRLLSGNGVEKDWAVGLRLVRSAARRGSAEANAILGLLAIESPVSFDSAQLKRALDLLRVAAFAGICAAQRQYVAVALERKAAGHIGDVIAVLRQAAARDEAWACYELGVVHDRGVGVAKNARQAYRYFCQAAALGDLDGTFNAGLMLLTGDGCQKDVAKASKWLADAADRGEPHACYEIGLLWDDGSDSRLWPEFSTFVRKEKAAEYYGRSARAGVASGQLNYGVCCVDGAGTRRRVRYAVDLYALSSLQGNHVAADNLAKCLCDGCGVRKDVSEGTWWAKCAEGKYRLWWQSS